MQFVWPDFETINFSFLYIQIVPLNYAEYHIMHINPYLNIVTTTIIKYQKYHTNYKIKHLDVRLVRLVRLNLNKIRYYIVFN